MAENVEFEFPFPEADPASTHWPVDQEPINLLALIPGDQPPMQEEVIAALRDHLAHQFAVLEELEPQSPDILWSFLARLGDLEIPVMLWLQPALPVPQGELSDEAAESCRWALGIETMLEPADPLSGYITLMRSLAGALSDSPAVLDINTTRIHTRAILDELFIDAAPSNMSQATRMPALIEPPAEDLWTIHAVYAEVDSARNGTSTVWLHTHGLSRCGLPELEMLDVPMEHLSRAGELLNSIAGMVLEVPPPPPGEPYIVGEGLAVTFQPWQEVVAQIDPQSPGGPRDRQDEDGQNMHVGVRAVVCSTKQACTWPREVIERLAEDDAMLYRTRRTTERQSQLARLRWDQLAMAFAAAKKVGLIGGSSPRAGFFIKAGFIIDGASGEQEREHLWFEPQAFTGEHVDATLINQPVRIAAMKRGDDVRIGRNGISDWQVQFATGSFGPDDIGQLWKAIDAMKASSSEHTASRTPEG
jgi:hypothetical protein